MERIFGLQLQHEQHVAHAQSALGAVQRRCVRESSRKSGVFLHDNDAAAVYAVSYAEYGTNDKVDYDNGLHDDKVDDENVIGRHDFFDDRFLLQFSRLLVLLRCWLPLVRCWRLFHCACRHDLGVAFVSLSASSLLSLTRSGATRAWAFALQRRLLVVCLSTRHAHVLVN